MKSERGATPGSYGALRTRFFILILRAFIGVGIVGSAIADLTPVQVAEGIDIIEQDLNEDKIIDFVKKLDGGPNDLDAMPALVKLVKNSAINTPFRRLIRREAVKVFGRVRGAAELTVPTLIEIIKNPSTSDDLATQATITIAEIQQPELLMTQTVTALIEAVRRPSNGHLQSEAAASLGHIGFLARSALETFFPILKKGSADTPLYQNTAKAFGEIAEQLKKRANELGDIELIKLRLQLEHAASALNNTGSNEIERTAENLEQANNSLDKEIDKRPLMRRVFVAILWITSPFVWCVIGCIYGGLALLWTVLTIFLPYKVKAFNLWLCDSKKANQEPTVTPEPNLKIRLLLFLKKQFGRFLAYILLVSFFCRLPRVRKSRK